MTDMKVHRSGTYFSWPKQNYVSQITRIHFEKTKIIQECPLILSCYSLTTRTDAEL